MGNRSVPAAQHPVLSAHQIADADREPRHQELVSDESTAAGAERARTARMMSASFGGGGEGASAASSAVATAASAQTDSVSGAADERLMMRPHKHHGEPGMWPARRLGEKL